MVEDPAAMYDVELSREDVRLLQESEPSEEPAVERPDAEPGRLTHVVEADATSEAASITALTKPMDANLTQVVSGVRRPGTKA